MTIPSISTADIHVLTLLLFYCIDSSSVLYERNIIYGIRLPRNSAQEPCETATGGDHSHRMDNLIHIRTLKKKLCPEESWQCVEALKHERSETAQLARGEICSSPSPNKLPIILPSMERSQRHLGLRGGAKTTIKHRRKKILGLIGDRAQTAAIDPDVKLLPRRLSKEDERNIRMVEKVTIA